MKIVTIGEDGEVVIIVRERRGKGRRKAKITVHPNLIKQMEIRAESVFRPDSEDVETAYALSGQDILDTLHKFTSKEVIRSATPFEIHTKTEAKIRQILEESEVPPKIVVDIHTHPKGSAELSDQDIATNRRAYDLFSKHFDEVYFGVHAVSEEMRLKRTPPKVEGNRIVWNSIRRRHEVAFFDKDGKPVSVEIFNNDEG